ncbi:MAG: 4Fe-4S dicluster domain-containing protein [Clostridiales Family XIII bacterium]|jgi:ferredoxin|nr:4Fe-4S dicluster domain-containing protein [Clostridiales Family XIII bacterium]
MDNKTITITKDDLATAIRALLPAYNVYAPAGEGERLAFAALDESRLGAINLTGSPVIPPKELLFPRSESLYTLDPETGAATVPEIAESTLIFGVRPCDLRGIENLDAAFLEKGYVDSNYAKRRENTTIIALACVTSPYETCFCESMGGDPLAAKGADVLLTETKAGDAFTAAFQTPKGLQVKLLWDSLAMDCGSAPAMTEGSKPAMTEGSKPAMTGQHNTLRVTKPDDLPQRLMAAFDDPHWAVLSEACLGCGTCSYVCPTCYCFDIDRESGAKEITEYRCWDCCMFSDYSRMAGGHNPRPTKKERLRNRYLHKLAYFDERYGMTLCVGCGRCIAKCPASLDITEVIEWGGGAL